MAQNSADEAVSLTRGRALRRLALILRPMPLIFRMPAGRDAGLRAHYYGRLWDSWGLGARKMADLLHRRVHATGSDALARQARALGFRTGNLREIHQRRRVDAPLADFLDQDERKGIHAIVNHPALPLHTNPLKNKALFEARCRAGGLALPAVITDARDAAAHDALIVKPGMGSKGKGVVRLVRQDSGDWRASDGSMNVAADDLGPWIARRRHDGWIVQQCMTVHPDLAELSPGALPTLRIVTVRNEYGAFEVVDTALRLSLASDRAADNFNMDNLVAPIAADAVLGPALRRTGGGFAELERHPQTGAPIAGTRLGLFDAARDLALRAHGHFADHALIGWDIGLSADGPVLIEGNWNPGYNVLQLVSGRGIGGMRLGELYRYHLEQAPEAAWRAATPVQVAQLPF